MTLPKGFPPEGVGPPGIAPLHGAGSAAPVVTPSGLGDNKGSKKMRTYEEIIAEAKENRNILEIKITRLNIEEDKNYETCQSSEC